MAKSMIDPDALIEMFEGATAKQGEQVRKAVSEATLRALQARELTLKNIRATLKSVTDAAGAGMAKNMGASADVPALLDKMVAGMDDALLRAVEANRTAMSTLLAQGADLRDKHMQKALDDIDKLEDTLLGVLRKAAQGADAQFGPAWGSVLEKLQAGGTLSGASAASTVEQMMEQMGSTMKSARQSSLRAAQALAESYATLASGVLIGMQEALQAPARAAAKAAPQPEAAAPAAKKAPRK